MYMFGPALYTSTCRKSWICFQSLAFAIQSLAFARCTSPLCKLYHETSSRGAHLGRRLQLQFKAPQILPPLLYDSFDMRCSTACTYGRAE